MQRILFIGPVLLILLAACAQPTLTPAPPPPGATLAPRATGVPGVYRPLQKGDVVEGATMDYVYAMPSSENPIVEIALGQNLLQLISINQQMTNGLVAFAQDITKEQRSILAFDENNPGQQAPTQMTIAPNKPLEVVIMKFAEGKHNWSVVETQDTEVRAAYKLVRRADGGLRFVMAYDLTALNNFATLLPAGRGAGLVLSARLAMLNLILTDPTYQRGDNPMSTNPPGLDKYDPRVLKTDPTKEGLAQNVDWVMVSRPNPNPGLVAP